MKGVPRKYLKLGSIVVVILLLAGGVYGYIQYIKKPVASTEPTFVCGDDIVRKANPIIAKNDLTAYAKLVDQIKAKSGYEHDVNCQYIVARNAIAVSDVSTAEASIKAIEDLRDNKGYGYSTAFSPAAMTPQELQDTLATVKLNKETQDKQNSEDTSYYDKK